MTRQELFALAEKRYGTAPEYPWQDDNAVLRRKDNEKWYAVVLRVADLLALSYELTGPKQRSGKGMKKVDA